MRLFWIGGANMIDGLILKLLKPVFACYDRAIENIVKRLEKTEKRLSQLEQEKRS
jgi:hypothetical protein